MNKSLNHILTIVFNLVYPLLKPNCIQRKLRSVGFVFPYYRFAKKLNYTGKVDFVVNGKTLLMQSYNQPFEMFIFWYGIFGYWEPLQLKVWSSLVRGADFILDIGANNGIYSLIASTNSEAVVYAFEPVPDVLHMLKENVNLNQPNNIEIVPSLVGERVGSEIIYIPRSGWVDVASVNKNFAEQFVGENKMIELVCPMTSVDSFLLDKKIPLEARILCKIDVEGAEKRVLNGMRKALSEYNISFTAELLDEDFYEGVISMLPSDYVVYAISEDTKKFGVCKEFVANTSNYYITRQTNLPNITI